MTRVLLDTNVVLDLFLHRKPFLHEAAKIWDMAETGTIEALIAAITPTTASYLIAKSYDAAQAHKDLQHMLHTCSVAGVGIHELETALQDIASGAFTDFEDAVQHAAAEAAGAEAIVTRNARDFRGARLPVYSPAELLAAR